MLRVHSQTTLPIIDLPTTYIGKRIPFILFVCNRGDTIQYQGGPSHPQCDHTFGKLSADAGSLCSEV